MTTGRTTSSQTVERVELREYYRWIGYDLDLRLHRMLHLDGFKVGLDGWAASILLRCDSSAVSPVRSIIEGKRIDVVKLVSHSSFPFLSLSSHAHRMAPPNRVLKLSSYPTRVITTDTRTSRTRLDRIEFVCVLTL